jgi:hypothetical protein
MLLIVAATGIILWLRLAMTTGKPRTDVSQPGCGMCT